VKPPSFIVNAFKKKQYDTNLLPNNLSTICQEARCPNRGECFQKARVAFLILGDTCTRDCKFCAVKKSKNNPLSSPSKDISAILKTIDSFKIKYVVITSVTRDDLPDGGAQYYVEAVNQIQEKYKNIKIELLTPDFKGEINSLRKVLEVSPFVFNHNLEVVPRVFPLIRPQGKFEISLYLLRYAKANYPSILVKTGIMVGVGETKEEVFSLIELIKSNNIDILTIGQYIAPTKSSYPVDRYVELSEYDDYISYGKEIGLKVIAGPLVRSSYMADSYV
jgi:lipoyl synthase